MSIVQQEDRGAVRHIVLNRPEKRNALNTELILALGEALRSAASDVSVRCVVVRGEGKMSGKVKIQWQKIAGKPAPVPRHSPTPASRAHGSAKPGVARYGEVTVELPGPDQLRDVRHVDEEKGLE